ncbi:metal ABC transporter ATP-binding protein [Clostridium sp. MSJ-8]|uniref:metal ABC transporter ATP-binding protein n=1 Tax=Clostridium sp. MSJ-8 TaxID=2841510 RepID=UPI001C0F10A4|nr:metal ABC transporter ATP-binding protein [Clostridium sp. MSJ-8]MBU5488585.1 metal ABC transporter ATP-binding protein [Clostridium sp. MSJ-8]
MIRINNLCFSYEKNSPMLINNLNLTIKQGMYLSILGENGSSKTTLIKLILGLLSPISGNITIDTKKLSYVPQRVDGFNSQFPISVYEVLKTHANILKLDNSEIDRVLEIVKMTEYRNRLIGNLSGGQRQRIFIARALMGNPDLIILDEPSTGVDYKTQLDIYSLLTKLNKNEHTTIISIEHNLDVALKYSTDILHFNKGTITLQSCSEFKKKLEMEGA